MRRSVREDAQTVIDRAVRAVLPDEAVRRALQGRHFPGRVILVAAGKVAWQMAQAAHQCLGDRISAGAAVLIRAVN